MAFTSLLVRVGVLFMLFCAFFSCMTEALRVLEVLWISAMWGEIAVMMCLMMLLAILMAAVSSSRKLLHRLLSGLVEWLYSFVWYGLISARLSVVCSFPLMDRAIYFRYFQALTTSVTLFLVAIVFYIVNTSNLETYLLILDVMVSWDSLRGSIMYLDNTFCTVGHSFTVELSI